MSLGALVKHGRRRALAAGFTLALAALAATRARAEDYVTLRGAYYREASTRVIQPTVEVERDSPSGWDVKAHFTVDTITSASVSAGTSTDAVFTETRNEAGLTVRKRWERTDFTVGYRYSAESDYWSHAMSATVAKRFWGDTASVAASVGLSLDTLSSRFRTPACAVPPSHSCPLNTVYYGLTYTQIFSSVFLGQFSLETASLDGFQGNLYRSVPNFGFEHVPDQRQRNAAAFRLAYYIPRASIALRLAYRYYFDVFPGAVPGADPWRLSSHMVEGRLYRPLTQSVSVRFSLRLYWQRGANFWCDALANPACYPPGSLFYSTDPKLGPMRTVYPEIELLWQAAALREVPVLGWLSAGTFAISYGRYIQDTTFGSAHLLQAGYTMPY